MTLAAYASFEVVAERLPLVFPEGTPNRTYCIRDLAVSTVFAALYVGAVEGTASYFGPAHVYRMSSGQAQMSVQEERAAYKKSATGAGFKPVGDRWYADNTREPIRDETLRDGLVPVGAVVVDETVPTTSGKGRYQLKAEFAALFDPALTGAALDAAITAFQGTHLSKGALARIAIMQAGAAANTHGVWVTFPSGEKRQLSPGPSTSIAQSVVEIFAPKFLQKAAVLWLSESGNKVVMKDDQLAAKLGLNIQQDKHLPDLILADVGPSDALIVFVEFVATDGAVNAQRQQALYALTDAAGFNRKDVAFVTAYSDRQSPGFRKTVSHLAWNSFAWFASEPDHIVAMRDGAQNFQPLSALVNS